ncbi:MAG: hypothetical protein E6Q97_27815 [Desulfurellales bacterium]|nr:MAG: hypothetical protein E6Q97_27815 [Desulfurellales bacterium]
MGQEVYLLFPQWEQQHKWQLYMACQEITKAVLALMLVRFIPSPVKLAAMAAAVWWTTQAVQEWQGNNNGTEQTWEYWLVAALALSVGWAMRRTTS